MKIATMVLAAGTSSRMGQDKQILSCGEVNFLEATFEKYKEFGDVYIVLGHNYDLINSESDLVGAKIIFNRDYELGMGSSLKKGIESLMHKRYDGIFITFCDMPHIKVETIEYLHDAAKKNQKEILVPMYKGVKGHPVYMPKHYFGEMLEIEGDFGARYIIKKNQDNTQYIEVDDQAIIEDLDNIEKYNIVKDREGWK